MAYDITIGNKTFEQYTEDSGYWSVDRVELPQAPLFPNDQMTGRSNMRSPGYVSWGDFITARNWTTSSMS